MGKIIVESQYNIVYLLQIYHSRFACGSNIQNPLENSESGLWLTIFSTVLYIYGLVQDSSNSSALAMELLQSCSKPLIWYCAILDNFRGASLGQYVTIVYEKCSPRCLEDWGKMHWHFL